VQLLHDPELIVLDEPLSGLDPVNADLFKSVIYELVEKGW
jgi:ABC-2 type transport system ATP-binding protein